MYPPYLAEGRSVGLQGRKTGRLPAPYAKRSLFRVEAGRGSEEVHRPEKTGYSYTDGEARFAGEIPAGKHEHPCKRRNDLCSATKQIETPPIDLTEGAYGGRCRLPIIF